MRFDPGLDERFVSQFIVALWVGLTRRSDAPDEMIGHRIAVQTTAPLETEEQDAVVAAVRRVSERAGWAAVTLRKVAQLAGVSDARLAARYPTRDHLAPLLWSGTVATVERRAGSRTSLDQRARVDGIVRDLADAACSDRALVSSLLTLRLRWADDLERDGGADPTDRIVALFGDLADPVVVGLAVDAVLMRAATSSVGADDLADAVLAGLRGEPPSLRVARLGRRGSVAQVHVDQPEERLVRQPSSDVRRDPFLEQRPGHLGGVADVRRDDAVGQVPERMAVGEWFGIGHVQAGAADLAALQRVDQVVGDDVGAPSRR